MGGTVENYRVYFDPAPIVPFLRKIALSEQADWRSKNGVDSLATWLSARTGSEWYVEQRTLVRVFNDPHYLICCHTADRWAIAFGYHPDMIWPEYSERLKDRAMYGGPSYPETHRHRRRVPVPA